MGNDNRLSSEFIVTSKRCLKCRWSKGYSNWAPIGAPKNPDTFYCTFSKVDTVTSDCPEYLEPYNEEEEQDV